MTLKSANDILNIIDQKNMTLYEVAIAYEMIHSAVDQDTLYQLMAYQWSIMKKAILRGLDTNSGEEIKGKLIEREAYKLMDQLKEDQALSGDLVTKAMAYALSTMEVNISMGLIVAAPTAGACGVLPGSLLAVQEKYHFTDQVMVESLFVAGLLGTLIARNASISGAKGGCQAEIGSAAAMTSAALIYLLGGSPAMSFDAAAIAINNLMGLICDPVAGLVEVPCHKRNAMGATNAIICAQMVLAGMPSVIPFDEVVAAMKQVGDLMPACHRETATGGIAATPTGKRLKENLSK